MRWLHDSGRQRTMTRILLVEDNELNRDMLTRRLTRRGYDVVVADDGAEGVRRARDSAPDLVLMDMSLPVIDGWEATRLLKADAGTRDIPVVALTAHAMAGDEEQARAAGCDDFDTKPVEIERLLRKIEALLAKRGPPLSVDGAAIATMNLTAATVADLESIRRFVATACGAHGADADVTDALVLAVDEACTNVIEHGYGSAAAGPLSVAVEHVANRVHISICDHAASFSPPHDEPASTESWKTRPLGGLGWPLIRSSVDDVRYTSANGENRLTLVKRLA